MFSPHVAFGLDCPFINLLVFYQPSAPVKMKVSSKVIYLSNEQHPFIFRHYGYINHWMKKQTLHTRNTNKNNVNICGKPFKELTCFRSQFWRLDQVVQVNSSAEHKLKRQIFSTGYQNLMHGWQFLFCGENFLLSI